MQRRDDWGILGKEIQEREREAARRERERREKEKHERWEADKAVRAQQMLEEQPDTLSGDIESSKMRIESARGGLIEAAAAGTGVAGSMYEKLVPDSLRSTWAAARQEVELVQTALDRKAVDADLADSARLCFTEFYGSLYEMLVELEARQIEYAAKDRKRYEDELSAPRRTCIISGPNTIDACTWADAAKPWPAYQAPPPTSPTVGTYLDEVRNARTVEQWQGVLQSYGYAVTLMDSVLLGGLSRDSSARMTFEYARSLLESQEKLRGTHPDALKIPAAFFPRDEYVDVKRETGEPFSVVKGIPWFLYAYHTGDTDGGSWVLEDLTAPGEAKVNEEEGRADADPPEALFRQLDSKLRFPVGALHVYLPSKTPYVVETHAETTVSEWLTYIGIGLAALGLVLITAGTAAPALVGAGAVTAGEVAFAGSAGIGIASTLVGFHEKAQHGMLTGADVAKGSLSMAADLASIFSLGLGTIARLGKATEAGATLVRAGRFAGNLWAPVGKVDKLLGAANIMVVTGEMVEQYYAIDQMPGLTPEQRDEARGRLIRTALLTGGMIFLPVAVKASVGRRETVHLEEVDGQLVMRGATDVSVPKAEVADPDAGAESWLRQPKRTEPRVDVNMPERDVVVKIKRGPLGVIERVDVRHGKNADPIDIDIHCEVMERFRLRYGGARGRLREVREQITRAFKGEAPPYLQAELDKHEKMLKTRLAEVENGDLTPGQIADRVDEMELIAYRLNEIRIAIADPTRRAHFSENEIAAEATPGPGFPPAPPGHVYYRDRVTDTWNWRPREGFKGKPRRLVYAPGAELPSGETLDVQDVVKRQILDKPHALEEVRATLESLGYSIHRDGSIYRPRGSTLAFPALKVRQGRVVPGTESAAEVQERLRKFVGEEALAKVPLQKGQKLVLVEGLFDTQAKWTDVLTPDREAELVQLLETHGIKQEQIDKFIQALVSCPDTIKVVRGTAPLRQFDYRKYFAETSGTAAAGEEVHHVLALYLGGSHQALAALPSALHAEVHAFFGKLTLPKNSALPDTPLDPVALYRAAGDRMQVGAAVITTEGKEAGAIRLSPIESPPPEATGAAP